MKKGRSWLDVVNICVAYVLNFVFRIPAGDGPMVIIQGNYCSMQRHHYVTSILFQHCKAACVSNLTIWIMFPLKNRWNLDFFIGRKRTLTHKRDPCAEICRKNFLKKTTALKSRNNNSKLMIRMSPALSQLCNRLSRFCNRPFSLIRGKLTFCVLAAVTFHSETDWEHLFSVCGA